MRICKMINRDKTDNSELYVPIDSFTQPPKKYTNTDKEL